MVDPAVAENQRSVVATFISWAWKLLLAVLAIAGGIGTAASKDFRDVIRDAAEWLYPLRLVVLLAVVAMGLLIGLIMTQRSLRRQRTVAAASGQAQHRAERRLAEHEQRAGHGRADHDARVLRAVRATLPRGDIDYWRDADLGGVWYGDKTRQLMEMLYDHNAIEDRFLDPELEHLRARLMRAVDDLMGKCATYGAAHTTLDNAYHLGDSDWVRDNPPEGERYERYEARRSELNDAADELVQAYDALMAEAQQRLPRAFAASA